MMEHVFLLIRHRKNNKKAHKDQTMQMSHFEPFDTQSTLIACQNWHEQSIIVDFLTNASANVCRSRHMGADHWNFDETYDTSSTENQHGDLDAFEYFMNDFCNDYDTVDGVTVYTHDCIDTMQYIIEYEYAYLEKFNRIEEIRKCHNEGHGV